jgi:hypothetical protein
MKPNNPPDPVDLYFMDARAKLIDIAAFMDRIVLEKRTDDFRYQAFLEAIKCLNTDKRTENVLHTFSDPTTEPLPRANTKSACGAWSGKQKII